MPEPRRSPASAVNAPPEGSGDPIPLDLPASGRLRVALTLMCLQASRAVLRHPLRSVLSGLGVAVGIAAVVWCVALGKASTDQAEAQFASLGDNLVWIEAGSRNVNGVRNGARGTTTLTLEDAEALRREIPQLTRVTPNVDGHVQIAYGNKNWNTQYRGIGPDYFAIKRWGLSEGAPMTDAEVNDSAAVCWIGQTVRNELFGGDDPIGKVMRVSRFPCVVVGVLEPKGQTGMGHDQDDTVLMPYTTVQHRILGVGITWLDDILCSAGTPEDIESAIDAATALLRQRHHIAPGEPDDFNIRRPDEILKARIQATQTLSWLLVALASIALGVGGIGVMNVMLASVAQRTREIGLRLAVGATARAVQLQFIGEAVMLTVLGGIAGLLLSLAGVDLFARTMHAEMSVSPEAGLLALGISAFVGLVCGLWPATRAARLDPITALRHE